MALFVEILAGLLLAALVVVGFLRSPPAALATGLAVTPAQAQYYHYDRHHHHGHDDEAAAAIIGGVIGAIAGYAIGSSNHYGYHGGNYGYAVPAYPYPPPPPFYGYGYYGGYQPYRGV